MGSNINPGLWSSFKLSLKNKDFDSVMQLFLNQLSQFANQILQQLTLLASASGLANILNGGGALNITSLLVSSNDLGIITTDQTINVNSAPMVAVAFVSATTQTRTITLNNLPFGSLVFITVDVTAGTLTLKVAGTTPAVAAYTVFALNTSTLAQTNLTATGLAIASVANAQLFAMAQLRQAAPSVFFYYV
jgi:hypothetical protein